MTNDAEQVLRVECPAHQREGGGSSPTARLLRGEWEVGKCSFELAKQLTRRFHYSKGGSNTRVLVCGLWRKGEWMDCDAYGVTWWIPPTKDAGAFIYPENPQGVLSLSRVVVIPGAPKNSCSFLIRHSMRFIDRQRWPVLVTYADEWQGHDGGIYRALADAGWREDGYTKPERTYVDQHGRMVSRKRGPRTYSHKEMVAQGYRFVGKFRRKRFVHRPSETPMVGVGKKRAGRLLDGREWNDMPDARKEGDV
jgi:hypothetical protein